MCVNVCVWYVYMCVCGVSVCVCVMCVCVQSVMEQTNQGISKKMVKKYFVHS